MSATIPGLQIGTRTPSSDAFDTVELKTPAANESTITCMKAEAKQSNALDAAWQNAYAPPQFFDFVAAAGSLVTSVPAATVRKAVLACQAKALKGPDENADVDSKGVHVECTAFVRDGGGVQVNVTATPDERAAK